MWVSICQKSFDRYIETYGNPDALVSYFGRLFNYLPYYEKIHALKMCVHPREGNDRPFVVFWRR